MKSRFNKEIYEGKFVTPPSLDQYSSIVSFIHNGGEIRATPEFIEVIEEVSDKSTEGKE